MQVIQYNSINLIQNHYQGFVRISMSTLLNIKCRFRNFEPVIESSAPGNQAAVSLITREGSEGVELLFIERACRDDDPWSGQMAFPGGRKSAADSRAVDAARRETYEEVGIRLKQEWNFGRLNDLIGRLTGKSRGLVISCHLFELKESCQLQLNYEVEDALWIPLASLINPQLFRPDYEPDGFGGVFQGIQCGYDDDRVIWGLTYRFLLGFFTAAQIDFPT